MATLVWTDVQLLVNQFDLTGFSNQVSLSLEAEPKDETVMGFTTRQAKAGLLVYSLSARTFWDSVDEDASDPVQAALVKGAAATKANEIATVGPEGLDENDPAYSGRYTAGLYGFGASIGDMLQSNLELSGDDVIVQSRIIAGDVSQTVSYAATKRQVGATSATQTMHAFMHVIAFDGTTLDADLRSDVDSAGGGETVRASFTQATGRTSEKVTDVGPVTDTWWDIDFTFVGTSFTAVVAIGIL